MSLLPFDRLPAYRERRFVPLEMDLGDWPQVAPCFDQLEIRASQCRTVEQLEQWLLEGSELRSALEQESSLRYIAMTCHTDDAQAEAAYLHFVEQVEPQLKMRQFRLEQLFLAHPCRRRLPQPRYQVFDRNTQARVDLFRPENLPLETEEARLGQHYQKLCGSLAVNFQGGSRTLAQMGRYLEEPDRALRQAAWVAVAERRLREVDRLESLFDQLLQVRRQIAAQAGCADYREYAFRARGRFDYGPEDCLQFHTTIEQEIVPLLRQLQAERRRHLRLPALKPWDLAVDPRQRPPLHPFDCSDLLLRNTQRILAQIDPVLAGQFERMQTLRLLDLDNRPGKAPGGYQCTLAESRLPFIFMNAVGMQRDVETLFHEAGHAFHVMATRDEPLFAYREAPIEFCEVASMTMELLGNEELAAFYPAAEARRARRRHLENIIEVFPWVATVDAFQHAIYRQPGLTRDERAEAWTSLVDRFGGDVDWSGHETARRYGWHRQLHLFLHPFYYIEYGIAQLGALQIWAAARRNRAESLRRYREGLSLGGSRPLPELFLASGCRFDFSSAMVRPLVAMVHDEWDRLQ